MSILKLVPILALCLLSSGCVGVAWWTKDRTTFKNPDIGEQASLDGVGDSRHRIQCPAPWLQSHWGAPTRVRVGEPTATEELWTYEFGRCWCGLIPMVIVPIPLVLPVGHEEMVFRVRDGFVVDVERAESRHGGFGFGLVGPDGPWAGGGF